MARLGAPAYAPFRMTYDLIIIGGGAAGLMCAMTAGQRGKRVAVLERNAEALALLDAYLKEMNEAPLTLALTVPARARITIGPPMVPRVQRTAVRPAPLVIVVPAVVRRPQEPVNVQDRPELTQLFPPNSEWIGTVSTRFGITDARAIVTSVRGSSVTMRIDRGGNTYNLVLNASGDQLIVARHEGVFLRGAPQPSRFSNVDIHGTIQSELLTLSGTWTRTPHGEPGTVDPNVQFKLRLTDKGKSPAAAADPIAEIFPPDSTYTGRWLSATGWQNITATVTSVKRGIATVRWENDHGVWDSQMELVGDRIKMRTCTGIGRSKQGGALSLITNIDMTGPSDAAAHAGTVRVSGSWDWYNPNTRSSKRGQVTALELDRN